MYGYSLDTRTDFISSPFKLFCRKNLMAPFLKARERKPLKEIREILSCGIFYGRVCTATKHLFIFWYFGSKYIILSVFFFIQMLVLKYTGQIEIKIIQTLLWWSWFMKHKSSLKERLGWWGKIYHLHFIKIFILLYKVMLLNSFDQVQFNGIVFQRYSIKR